MVLLALAVVSLLAVAVARQGRSAAQSASAVLDRARTEQGARSAAEIGIAAVLAGRREEEFLVTTLGDLTLLTVIEPEAADRLDLNEAEAAPLRELLTGLERQDGAALAARIMDWRDADDRTRPGGAESAEYERLGLAPPRNGVFLSLFDLDAVAGLDAETAGRLRSEVTVWGGGAGAAAPSGPGSETEQAPPESPRAAAASSARARAFTRAEQEAEELQQAPESPGASDVEAWRIIGAAYRDGERRGALLVTISLRDSDTEAGQGYVVLDWGSLGNGYRLDEWEQSAGLAAGAAGSGRAALVDR
nr:type II secretion system protein GspK [Parvularcula maris]